MMAEAMDLNVAFQTFDGTTCSRPGDIRVVASGAGSGSGPARGGGATVGARRCPTARLCAAALLEIHSVCIDLAHKERRILDSPSTETPSGAASRDGGGGRAGAE